MQEDVAMAAQRAPESALSLLMVSGFMKWESCVDGEGGVWGGQHRSLQKATHIPPTSISKLIFWKELECVWL